MAWRVACAHGDEVCRLASLAASLGSGRCTQGGAPASSKLGFRWKSAGSSQVQPCSLMWHQPSVLGHWGIPGEPVISSSRRHPFPPCVYTLGLWDPAPGWLPPLCPCPCGHSAWHVWVLAAHSVGSAGEGIFSSSAVCQGQWGPPVIHEGGAVSFPWHRLRVEFHGGVTACQGGGGRGARPDLSLSLRGSV